MRAAFSIFRLPFLHFLPKSEIESKKFVICAR